MFPPALKMRRTLRVLTAACAGFTSPGYASAQDIAPVISPGQAAEGAFHRSRMGAKAVRQRQARAQAASPSVVRERQRQSCASLPRFRRQYGAQHPQVLKLQELCARHGF
jgi:hypothetical protein